MLGSRRALRGSLTPTTFSIIIHSASLTSRFSSGPGSQSSLTQPLSSACSTADAKMCVMEKRTSNKRFIIKSDEFHRVATSMTIIRAGFPSMAF